MVTKRIAFCLLFSITVLFGCQRIYQDGETQEIGWFAATLDVFMGKPERKKQEVLKPKELTGDEVKDVEIIKENKMIEIMNAKIIKHNKGAEADKEEPDEGALPILLSILGTAGLGAFGHLLERRRLHRLRANAESERALVMAGYQEIKEGLRDDDEALETAKMLFNTGMKVWNSSKDNVSVIIEDVDSFKDDYIKLRAVHKDIA